MSLAKTWMATAASALVIAGLSSCGGGGGSSGDPPPPVPTPNPAPLLPSTRISADSPVLAGCTGGSASGTLFANAEVEPFAAVHPANANIMISGWQQDRWSNGGARALVTAVSSDAGNSWTRHLMPFSRCGGAAAGSSGDYERASDPWVDIGPSGIMYSMALAFTGTAFTPGASSALLASRSIDGGLSWSTPATLLRDGETLFNDKNALTADPTDARYAYAVWDRLETSNFGPTLLARTVNGGASWESARIIYSPKVSGGIGGGISQTIGNRIVVLQDGTLVNLFTQIDTVGSQSSSWLGVLRSSDKGLTWGAPIRISDLQAVGARDPKTGKAIRDGATLAAIAVGPAGSLWLTWQDARFSGGLRDAIAVARSNDGGLTWSAPIAINRDPNVAAFTPSVAVSADGVVAISHYDLRPVTLNAGSLLAGAWLLTSRDGVNWVETKIWSPFDMAQAPDARGLFLGDYQGLVSAGAGAGFLPVLALSSQDSNNRTDIYALRVTPTASAMAAAKILARPLNAKEPKAGLSDADFARARHTAIVTAMERRLPGWAQRFGLVPGEH